MNRLHWLARVSDARRPSSSAVVLLVLLAQVAACLPEPEPGPDSLSPDQSTGTPAQPTDTPPVRTSPYSLTAPLPDSGIGTEPGTGTVIRGVLTHLSFGATDDYRYDAYVVTARQSGAVRIKSDVIESQRYPYGYGYPLDVLTIEEGFKLVAWASNDYQNALETGTAILEQQVEAGRQYILLYKTFDAFTPVTYRLTVPPTLIVEGRIYRQPGPVPVSPNSTGLITLENPRPEVLGGFMTVMPEWTSYHR